MSAPTPQRALHAEARRVLAAALAGLPGPKALLVDDALYVPRLAVVSPLDLFADPPFLSEHGVRHVAPLSQHRLRPDSLASQHAFAILIRGVNAAAAREAVTLIRAMHQRAMVRQRESADVASVAGTGGRTPAEKASGGLRNTTHAQVKFLVLTIPRRSSIVEKILHEAGLPEIPVAPLPLPFLPFDADLVSLDWPDAYRQVVLEGDNSAILATAAALSSLATTLNLEYDTIRTAGAAATAVAEELMQTHGQMYSIQQRRAFDSGSLSSSPTSSPAVLRKSPARVAQDAFTTLDVGPSAVATEKEEGAPTLAQVVGESRKRRCVKLVIIDRGVDLVTPMLTQWTYEGLLEEAIWMHNTMMDLPVAEIVSDDAKDILKPGAAAGAAAAESSTTGTVRRRLRGDVDGMFGELRDQNYWAAAGQIQSVAKSVRKYYDARPQRETAEMSQVKEYVKGLRDVKSEHRFAATHTAIAAEISARTFDSYEFKRRFEVEREMIEGSTGTGRRVFITDGIARGESLWHILRLCCLWSVTSAGIDGEEFDFLRKELVGMFGLKTIPLLANLERSSLLTRSTREPTSTNLSWIPFPNFGGRTSLSDSGGSTGGSAAGSDSTATGRLGRGAAVEYSWQFARAAMRLVGEFDPDKAVTSGTAAAVAAPYSGYTPLSVRLVEAGLSRDGWGALPAVVAHTSLLPPGHATVEHRRGTGSGGGGGGDDDNNNDDNDDDGTQGEADGVQAVVVFVGGVGRAEASAVRLAASKGGVQVLIATTAVVSPDGFVGGLRDGGLVERAG